MALIASNQIKSIVGSSRLEFVPREGESAVIKGIYIYTDTIGNNAFGNYALAKVTVGKSSISVFPVKVFGEDMVSPAKLGGIGDFNLFIRRNGWNFSIPVGEGQKAIIETVDFDMNPGGDKQTIFIIYDRYDASDIKGTEENGSYSDTLWYFNYIVNDEPVGVNDEVELNKSYLPAEFAEFPASIVPSKSKIRLLGIIGNGIASYVDSGNYVYTKYLKLYYRRRVLFDDDLNGLPFVPHTSFPSGVSENCVTKVSVDEGKFGYVFSQALDFYEGDELTLTVKTAGIGSAEIDAEKIGVLLILKIEPLR